MFKYSISWTLLIIILILMPKYGHMLNMIDHELNFNVQI